jgi:hypothetical protein
MKEMYRAREPSVDERDVHIVLGYPLLMKEIQSPKKPSVVEKRIVEHLGTLCG